MFKNWIEAFRLRTLPLAFACIGMGGIIAASQQKFDALIFSLTLCTAFLLQILSNIANDYGDSINGADSDKRVGPSRAVQTGKISAQSMKNAIVLFSIVSFICGVLLIYLSISSMNEFLIFIGIGVISMIAAITYTVGKNPYGYAGFGDISVLIFFGCVAVGGTYYLQTNILDIEILLPAMTCGLFAVGVLNINNIRDIESDQEAGKYSIPVRIGRKKAVYYHWALLFFGWLSAIIYVVLNYQSLFQFLFVITLPLFIINARAVLQKKEAKELDPFLKQMAISTLIFVIIFGIGQLI